MGIWCSDYKWEKGIPVKCTEGRDFLLLTDPYGKRYIIEAYRNGIFERIVYDSTLLDYRKLNPRDKLGWSKETLQEETLFLLRDRDHTPILIERYRFEGDFCRECYFLAPHNQDLILGHQKIFYTDLGDAFDGVTLFDPLQKRVLTKKYALNPDKTFGELLCEE